MSRRRGTAAASRRPPAEPDRPVPPAAAAGADPFEIEAWPERISPELASLLVGTRMIGYYEHQPASVIAAFQRRRIARLIAFLSERPWWRAHFAGALGRVIGLTDLPILSREGFREAVAQAGRRPQIPPEHGGVAASSTSGSSGIPVSFLVSRHASRMIAAQWQYDDVRQGRDLSLTAVELRAGVPRHAGDCITTRVDPLAAGRLLRRHLPAWPIEDHAAWLAKVQPAYISTIPTVLDGLLDVFESGAVPCPSVRQIATMSETVTPTMRERARRLLGAAIRDRYSCEEIGPIAFQCPQSDEHYHVAATHAVVEVVDEAGRPCPPGIAGRVLATGLHNYASPAIRYDLGDTAAWQPRCACGYDGGALTEVLGRTRFLVRLPSGKRVAIGTHTFHLVGLAPLRESRIVQVSPGEIELEVVLDRPLAETEREALVRALQRSISPELSYRVRQVERIAWTPGHKRQDVISLV